ncbi:hypothetical protein J1N35_025856 [Gossypium stocksii]|uniref:Reverse transcriptase domain-containing protein n=1 Tax=Gossypium stocksii TaxID=47602 RepID=A0A9D3V9Q7_9ROSI|nr:hypothetical protein J1N35_025856 [Gossypium stocksii]
MYIVDNYLTGHFPVCGRFSKLETEDITGLLAEVIEEEVRRSVSSMSPLKAPGMDGFHAKFYQANWEIVGVSIFNFVKSVFEGNDLDPRINRTLLVLIPKVFGAETINQYRPIILCNVLYKFITKTIVIRLRQAMQKLFKQNQSSFIAGRNISDNIVIHTMKSSKGKKGWMVIKVDLEKAYDKIRWDFLKDTLIDAGFPMALVSIIMQCVTSYSLQLFWNGSLSEEFKPSRGVRQGDPLSPYLFVLGMERLGHLIEASVEKGSWEPIKLSHEDANGLSAYLGFSRVTNLGKYLRMPLFHHRVGRNSFSFVLYKVRNRLNGWDARKLSFAGRLTLVKAVLLSIPNYFMTPARMPITICKEIEKVTQAFLWGSNNERRKVALVSWNEVCKPVEKGGLGIRQLHDQNRLFLLKIGFQLVSKTDSLWVQILRNKYNIHGTIPNVLHRNNCSYVWCSIVKVWDNVKQGLVWIIQDGLIVNFWNDVWIHDLGPLKAYYIGVGAIDETICICDVTNAAGGWNYTWLLIVLPREFEDDGVIRKTNTPQRVQTFLWMLVQNKRLTNEERVRRALVWSKSYGIRMQMPHLSCSSKTEQKWQRPETGWVKVNVDGSVVQQHARAVVGGGVKSDRLKLAWLEGHKQVELNCDNGMLIDTICNGFAPISNVAEVRLIHEWYNKDWKVTFRHVGRRCNKVADCLAKLAVGRVNQVVLFPKPPQHVLRLLEEDSHGHFVEFLTGV